MKNLKSGIFVWVLFALCGCSSQTASVNAGNNQTSSADTTSATSPTTPELPTVIPVVVPLPTNPVYVSVSSATALSAALASRSANSVINLAAGNYGSVNVTGTTPVYLAATLGAVVRFSSFNMNGLNTVSISGVQFVGDVDYGTLNVSNSSNVSVQNCSFINGTSASGTGINVSNSNHVLVNNNTFTGLLQRAGVFADSQNIILTNNILNGIKSDGFDCISVDGFEVAHNKMSDFHPGPEDHPDGIQCFNAGATSPSRNIYIHHNHMFFDSFTGASQGIFISGLFNGGTGYFNTVINYNVIYTGIANGIAVQGHDGVEIKGNIVVLTDHNQDPLFHNGIAIVSNSSKNVSIQDNVANYISTDGNATINLNGNRTNFDVTLSWMASNNTGFTSNSNTVIVSPQFTSTSLPGNLPVAL